VVNRGRKRRRRTTLNLRGKGRGNRRSAGGGDERIDKRKTSTHALEIRVSTFIRPGKDNPKHKKKKETNLIKRTEERLPLGKEGGWEILVMWPGKKGGRKD